MAESITRATNVSVAKATITASAKNGAGIRAQFNQTIDEISVSEKAVNEFKIAASGNITLTPAGLLGSLGDFKVATIAIKSGSVSSSMTIEINNSGVTIACGCWSSFGSTGGISQIEIVNSDPTNVLQVTVLVAR